MLRCEYCGRAWFIEFRRPNLYKPEKRFLLHHEHPWCDGFDMASCPIVLKRPPIIVA